MADLPLLDEFTDRAGDILDRDARVDAVLVEQVDHVAAEPLQGCVGDAADLFRATVEPDALAVLDAPPELGGDLDLAADRLEGLADELFVQVWPVYLGGVEERHAQIGGGAEHGDHVVAAPWVGSVALRHPHAAQSDRGDLEPLTEGACVHVMPP